MSRIGGTIVTLLVLVILINTLPAAPGIQGEIVTGEPTGTRGTIVVNASGGGDYTHLQWAIDNASEGDTVYVEAGIYNETVEIAKSITLTGESLDRTMITGEGRIVNVSADGVNISGFTVTGSTVAYEGIGIYLENVRNCNVSGNNCSNNSYCGISLQNTSHISITDNICNGIGITYTYGVYSTDGMGILVCETEEVLIDNNLCSNNTLHGIEFLSVNHSTIRNNTCSMNGGVFNIGKGILLSKSNNNTIASNNCSGNFAQGILCYCGSGIVLSESRDNTIVQNDMYENYENGICLSNSDNNEIQNNFCMNQSNAGINLYLSDSNVLFSNQLFKTYWGGGISISNSEYNIVDHNHIEGNCEGIWMNLYTNYSNIIGNNILNNSVFLPEPEEGFAINLDLYDDHPSANNRIHHNNIHDNADGHESQARDSMKGSSWNSSLNEGNYWSDYTTRYPNAQNDGNVWNQSYKINGDHPSSDLFPLVSPVEEGVYYPVAMFDIPSEMDQHDTITFDGERCYDHLGIANYTWDLENDGDHFLVFGISPDFTFEKAGNYTVRLTVTNTQGNRDRAISRITVRDIEPPTANAGPNDIIEPHQTYQFNASSSSDNVGIVNFSWSFLYDGEWITLYGATPSFTFDIPDEYSVVLTVKDMSGNRANDTMELTVLDEKTNDYIIVDISGNGDYTRIQEGIDNVDAGGTVYVEEGTYFENVVIEKPLKLIGASNKKTIIDGKGKKEVKLLINYTNYVDISGFHISHGGTISAGTGLAVYGGSHCRIENNIITNCKSGIAICDSVNTIVSNNICSDNSEEGIYVTDGALYDIDNNSIINNTCNSNRWAGIFIEASDWINVENNTCESNRHNGIFVAVSSNNTINNNTCSSSELGIGLAYSHINVVSNNNCKSNFFGGITLQDSDKCTLSHNICNLNDEHGIILWRSNYNSFSRNTCCFNNGSGMYFEDSNGNKVYDNSIKTNKENGLALNRSNHNEIDNNNIRANGYGILSEGSSENSITNNSCHENYDGIWLENSARTIIKYNEIEKNIHNNIILKKSDSNIINRNYFQINDSTIQAFDDGMNNAWDDGNKGNYWSDYESRYPNAVQMGDIWDTPYEIEGGDSKDNHPLCDQDHILPAIPTAMAGQDVEIEKNGTVFFDSTSSSDDMEIITYTWTFTYDGKEITLKGPSPNFTFEIPGTYLVTLTVTDAQGYEGMDAMYVTVLPEGDLPSLDHVDPVDDNGDDREKGGIVATWILLMGAVLVAGIIVVLLILLRKKKGGVEDLSGEDELGRVGGDREIPEDD